MSPKPRSQQQAAYFKRWELGWERTSAYRLFKAHHTELNNLYWAHAPALRFVFAATRGKSPKALANSLFPLSAPNESRVHLELRSWGDNYGAFDNWVRLSALVAITGYLEVYIGTVIRLALDSDPGVIIGSPRCVDGVANLKTRKKTDHAISVKLCTIGRWSDRIVAYEKLFGIVPDYLRKNISALERLRKTRNGVAHTFGRASNEYQELLQMKVKPFKKISEVQLQKALGLADGVALAIDKHLGPSHIGDYESLLFYHRWDKKFDLARQTEAKALRAELFRLVGRNKLPLYYEQLISAYKRT